MTTYATLQEKISAEKAERTDRYAAFATLYFKASEAGRIAATEHVPTPMGVSQHSNPLNDSSPAVVVYVPGDQYVEAAQARNPQARIVVDPGLMDGMCGFGWVNVSPGNSSFANWLKKEGHARKAYGGGVDIWIGAYGQSYERKVAHARAMAAVIQEGLTAMGQKGRVYGTGRLD